ncbi:MAG: hypothetical protein GJT30_02780 [Geobacter sp.]|nr:hypothetical protein [Geobacter sp.]
MYAEDDLGASVFKTWSNTQRRDEIAKLVEGYRNGLPVGVLCKMTETIAGSRKQARKHLMKMMTPEERQAAIGKESGGMLLLVQEFLA